MAKKTLEEKIKNVSWYTLGLSILYFSIGGWLKSDGFHFDPAKTYDLIKDTLTLTAAFLAPVAAFILFSDWREEHRVKLLYSSIDEIKKLVREIEDALSRIKMNIYQRDLKQKELISVAESTLLQKLLTTLSRLYIDINIEIKDDDLEKFTSLINTFGLKVNEAKNKLGIVEYSSLKINQLRAEDTNLREEQNTEEITFYFQLFDENLSAYEEYYKEVKAISDQMILIGSKIKNKI